MPIRAETHIRAKQNSAAHASRRRREPFDLPLDTPPMEAKSEEELPREKGWQFEPKWDGFRCLAFRQWWPSFAG